jgi:ankyrin repeat protein
LKVNYSERFFYSIRVGDMTEVRKLLQDNPELANTREQKNVSALHVAAQLGHLDLASLLLDRGAQIESVCGNIGSTPLKYAVFFAQIDMVKLLLKRGADVQNTGATSRTPLDLAMSATTPLFRDMGTPGTDLDYAIIVKILRSKSLKA